MENAPRPEIDLVARCACGGVSVHAKGIVRSMLLCACEDCQKATGTGHSAIIIMRAADVQVEGATASFASAAESGATLTRWFCHTCGTPLNGQSSRAETLVNLPAGLFGAATADWFVPSQLIFARSHRDWDALPDTLPQHATYRVRQPDV
jgi:hypothetical protein